MKFLVLAALIAVAVAETAYPSESYSDAYSSYPEAYPSYSRAYDRTSYETAAPYAYSYAVRDEASYNDFSQSERRDGNVVTGFYRVALPDGRVQVVTYRADEYGYRADVTYEGEASYPAYTPSTYTSNKKNVYPASYSNPRY